MSIRPFARSGRHDGTTVPVPSGVHVSAYLTVETGTGVMLAAIEVANDGLLPVTVRDWGFDIEEPGGPSLLGLVSHAATSSAVPAEVAPGDVVEFRAELLPMLAIVLMYNDGRPSPLVPYARVAGVGRVQGTAWGVEDDWWCCAAPRDLDLDVDDASDGCDATTDIAEGDGRNEPSEGVASGP